MRCKQRHVFTDRVNTVGNAIASVCPSVRLSVCFYIQNRVTLDLDLLREYG